MGIPRIYFTLIKTSNHKYDTYHTLKAFQHLNNYLLFISYSINHNQYSIVLKDIFIMALGRGHFNRHQPQNSIYSLFFLSLIAKHLIKLRFFFFNTKITINFQLIFSQILFFIAFINSCLEQNVC